MSRGLRDRRPLRARVRRARPDRRDRRGHRRPRPRAHRLLPRRRATRAPQLDRDTLAALDARADDRRPRPHRGRRDARAARARGRRCTTRARSCARCASSAARCRTIRACFDLMAYDTDDDWEVVAPRAWRACPTSLASLEAALRDGMARGHRRGAAPGARLRRAGRDVGRRGPDAAPFFATLAARHAGDATLHAELEQRGRGRDRRVRASSPRSSATSTRRRPTRAIRSAASATRCSRASFNGIELDLDETYAWGWEELYRIEDAMRAGRRAHPARRAGRRGRSSTSTTTRTRTIEGVDEFQQWNQELIDHDDRRAQRHALRHRRAAAPVRGDDRAARRRGRDVLHGPERGLHAGPGARGTRRWARHDVPAVARGEHLLPRGRSRPSPAGRAGEYLADELVAVPARCSGSSRATARAGRSTPSG